LGEDLQGGEASTGKSKERRSREKNPPLLLRTNYEKGGEEELLGRQHKYVVELREDLSKRGRRKRREEGLKEVFNENQTVETIIPLGWEKGRGCRR